MIPHSGRRRSWKGLAVSTIAIDATIVSTSCRCRNLQRSWPPSVTSEYFIVVHHCGLFTICSSPEEPPNFFPQLPPHLATLIGESRFLLYYIYGSDKVLILKMSSLIGLSLYSSPPILVLWYDILLCLTEQHGLENRQDDAALALIALTPCAICSKRQQTNIRHPIPFK